MHNTFSDEYQKQFFEWQKQVTNWQRKFFDTWLETLPADKTANPTEVLNKALSLQEELVKSYLETQEKTTKMMLEAQREFWDDYFARMHNGKTPD